MPVVWGKATADWAAGNTVTLDPCDEAGADTGQSGFGSTYMQYLALDRRGHVCKVGWLNPCICPGVYYTIMVNDAD